MRQHKGFLSCKKKHLRRTYMYINMQNSFHNFMWKHVLVKLSVSSHEFGFDLQGNHSNQSLNIFTLWFWDSVSVLIVSLFLLSVAVRHSTEKWPLWEDTMELYTRPASLQTLNIYCHLLKIVVVRSTENQ